MECVTKFESEWNLQSSYATQRPCRYPWAQQKVSHLLVASADKWILFLWLAEALNGVLMEEDVDPRGRWETTMKK